MNAIRRLPLTLLLLWPPQPNAFADTTLVTSTIHGTIPVKSWKALRDKDVVKQQFDYSCGAASLATVLQFYGASVTEKQLMDGMQKNDNVASFDDMAKVLPKFGFKAHGVALSYEQLTRLQIPAIAYLKPEREDHFTVIRGVSETHVWLGDPSWGNRVLSREQFLKMWSTRDDQLLVGKLLLIQPIRKTVLRPDAFGEPKPRSLPVRLQTQRQF